MKEQHKIQHKIQKYMEYKHTKSALIIAHRGGCKGLSIAENSMEAFANSIKQKVTMIEFDVRRTKDHQLVVFHNDHINHTKLNNLTYKELCKYASLEGYEVPLFHDVVALCSGKVMLDVELKESGYEHEVLSILDPYYTPDHYVITSFIDEVIIQIKKLDPNIMAGLLIGMEQAGIRRRITELFPFKRIKRTGADFVVPNYRLVTPWLLRICKKSKCNVYVWTVNGDNIYNKLISKKVSAIITDYPERYNGNYVTD